VPKDLVFQPIVTKKIYEEIVDQIRELIARGELKPGQKLPSEREMSESMGVSRASVREALTAMEAIGILDIRPGEGTFVKETSSLETFKPLAFVLAVEKNPGQQMMEVRRVLESESAALAALRADEEHLIKIRHILDQMKSAGNTQLGVEYDLKFHFAIAEATQNSILLRIMNTVADLMHHTFRLDREKLLSRNSHQIYSEHEAIYQAIKERTPQIAREKMIEHINNIEKGMEHSFELEGEN
jgi:GntR family transcriptional repressor for pyruvate dehydrogenase complex